MRRCRTILLSLGFLSALSACSSPPTAAENQKTCFSRGYFTNRSYAYTTSRSYYGYQKPFFGYGGYGAHRNGC